MRITGLDVIVVKVNHRGDWLHVRLTTDEGVTGIGEASHGGHGPHRDVIVAAVLREQCAPRLIGKDPCAVQARIQELAGLMEGLPATTAVSACEQALWDLAGKAAGLPVYRLLGGPCRERVPLYANINRSVVSRTPEEFARNAAAAVSEGFAAVKLAPFDGMNRRRVRDRDQRERIAHGLACVGAVRDAVGPGVEVYVDCHSHFDVPTAVEVARELRNSGVTWFEEPVPTEDLDALVRLRPLVGDMELIGGEQLAGVAGFWPYLAAGVWECAMPDVKHCGGIWAAVAIAEACAARGVAVAPHNPSGPVAHAASVHVAAAIPHLRWLEYAWGEVPWRGDLVTPAERIEGGAYVLSDAPGLGVELDQSAVGGRQSAEKG